MDGTNGRRRLGPETRRQIGVALGTTVLGGLLLRLLNAAPGDGETVVIPGYALRQGRFFDEGRMRTLTFSLPLRPWQAVDRPAWAVQARVPADTQLSLLVDTYYLERQREEAGVLGLHLQASGSVQGEAGPMGLRITGLARHDTEPLTAAMSVDAAGLLRYYLAPGWSDEAVSPANEVAVAPMAGAPVQPLWPIRRSRATTDTQSGDNAEPAAMLRLQMTYPREAGQLGRPHVHALLLSHQPPAATAVKAEAAPAAPPVRASER